MDHLQHRLAATAAFALIALFAAIAAWAGSAHAGASRQPVSNPMSFTTPSAMDLAVARPKDCDPNCGGERQLESRNAA